MRTEKFKKPKKANPNLTWYENGYEAARKGRVFLKTRTYEVPKPPSWYAGYEAFRDR